MDLWKVRCFDQQEVGKGDNCIDRRKIRVSSRERESLGGFQEDQHHCSLDMLHVEIKVRT